ncbi:MAG: hypothetical protein AAF927_25515 [Bacteroidota bacterium]
MRTILFALLYVMIPSLVWAQDGRRYSNGQEEYFGGAQLPSMRAEAMGRAQVAIGGSIMQNFINPASIGTIKFRSLDVSSSGPFYLLDESDYGYVGFAQRINDSKWVGGVSVRAFLVGPTTFDATINGQKYELDKSRTINTTVSVAREILPGLQLGLNANLYRLRLFRDADAGHMPHLDLGLLYTKALSAEQNLRLGLSVNNFLFGRIAYKAPNGDEDIFNMPAIMRVGASYSGESSISLPQSGTGSLRYLLTVEFQDYLNNDYYTALRVGGELVIWDLLALRIGAFRRNNDDGGRVENFRVVRDFTYGFGLIVPLNKISKQSWPIRMHLDYTSLQQARTSNFISGRIPNMRGLSIRLAWIIDSQS